MIAPSKGPLKLHRNHAALASTRPSRGLLSWGLLSWGYTLFSLFRPPRLLCYPHPQLLTWLTIWLRKLKPSEENFHRLPPVCLPIYSDLWPCALFSPMTRDGLVMLLAKADPFTCVWHPCLDQKDLAVPLYWFFPLSPASLIFPARIGSISILTGFYFFHLKNHSLSVGEGEELSLCSLTQLPPIFSWTHYAQAFPSTIPQNCSDRVHWWLPCCQIPRSIKAQSSSPLTHYQPLAPLTPLFLLETSSLGFQ